MNTERQAAERLLNNGIKAQVTAPLLFRMVGIRNVSIVIRAPFYGTLARISRIYLSARISEKQLAEMDSANIHILFLRHHVQMSKVAATGWLNNWLLGILFTRPVAWWFRWHLDNQKMQGIVNVLTALSNRKGFTNTIKLVDGMRVMTPNLSQPTPGS